MRDYISRHISAVYITDDQGQPTAVDILDAAGQSLLDPLPAPPAIIGTIMDRSYVVGSGPYTIDLASKFDGATSYQVTPQPAGVSLDGATLTIDPVAPLAVTQISVRGIGIGGQSAPITFALTVEAAVTVTAPAAPVLSLVGKAADAITVSWPAPANAGSAITGYRLYVDGTVAVASASSPQAIVGLEPETEYSITVSAVNAVGEGPQSAALVVTTNAVAIPPCCRRREL